MFSRSMKIQLAPQGQAQKKGAEQIHHQPSPFLTSSNGIKSGDTLTCQIARIRIYMRD
jgi:hypothetical protein